MKSPDSFTFIRRRMINCHGQAGSAPMSAMPAVTAFAGMPAPSTGNPNRARIGCDAIGLDHGFWWRRRGRGGDHATASQPGCEQHHKREQNNWAFHFQSFPGEHGIRQCPPLVALPCGGGPSSARRGKPYVGWAESERIGSKDASKRVKLGDSQELKSCISMKLFGLGKRLVR